jgi:transcriptional regulator with XRE-family HTH domain
MARRTSFSAISSKLVHYLAEKGLLNQSQIAEVLDVDKSFISRVASREREFSPTQMQQLADHLNLPLGVLLLDSNRPTKPATGKRKEILDLCERLIHQCDAATAEARRLTARRAEARRAS